MVPLARMCVSGLVTHAVGEPWYSVRLLAVGTLPAARVIRELDGGMSCTLVLGLLGGR